MHLLQPLLKKAESFRQLSTITCLSCAASLCILLNSCDSGGSRDNSIIISVADQEMLLVNKGQPVKTYPVSTSKFGLGSKPGSMRTPLGRMEVARKIGAGAPAGAVFKSRKRTGEVLRVNAPGRDPIITRILWLRGKERDNRNTFARYIYIHGTPEERHIGHKVSYGCVRMKSRDVIHLYKQLAVGSQVQIIEGSLGTTSAGLAYATRSEGYLPAAGN